VSNNILLLYYGFMCNLHRLRLQCKGMGVGARGHCVPAIHY